MALGFAMPEFAGRTPLSATDLNKLSSAQRYMRNTLPPNYGFREINNQTENYLFHRYRYLHWRVAGAVNSRLRINNVDAGLQVGNDLYGVIDLNAFNLPMQTIYTVRWDGGTASGMYFIEHPTNALGTIFYPEGVTNFGTPATIPSVTLNRLARNMQYLIDNHALPPSGGMTRSSFRIEPSSTSSSASVTYYIRHTYRYLYIFFSHKISGITHTRVSRVYYGAQQIFNASISSSQRGERFFTAIFDLEGAGSEVYQNGPDVGITVFAQPSPLPALGAWYGVRIYGSIGAVDDIRDTMHINFVGEVPEKAFF